MAASTKVFALSLVTVLVQFGLAIVAFGGWAAFFIHRPLIALAVISMAMIGTIGGETTRWLGVVLYTLGGVLRMWPVFVLGSRFSGLVAIQPGHTLETHGIYSLVRNPS